MIKRDGDEIVVGCSKWGDEIPWQLALLLIIAPLLLFALAGGYELLQTVKTKLKKNRFFVCNATVQPKEGCWPTAKSKIVGIEWDGRYLSLHAWRFTVWVRKP